MFVELGEGCPDFCHTEQGASNDRKHEEKDDQEEAKRGQGLRRIEQRVEYYLQLLGLLYESEYTTDP